MGKDHPDWGGVYNDAQFYPLFDQAELAARLDSVITYDRRGSLLWWYDFRYGIGDVGPTESGAGSDVRLSSTIWERPPFSCVLESGTVDGAYARINRRVPVPVSNRVGFQASVRAGANVSKVYLDVWHYDGTTVWYSYLEIDLDNNTLKVKTGDADLVTLDSDFPDLTTGYYFAHFKLVVDLADHTLVRALVDGSEYDLSAYAMASQASDLAPHLYTHVSNQGHNLTLATVNVDSLIITAAEP